MQMILPYLDQAALYNQITPYFSGTTAPWNGWPGIKTIIPPLMCPSDPAGPKLNTYSTPLGFQGNYLTVAGTTHFNVNNGVNLDGMFYPMSSVRIRDIVDGTSNQIMAGEIILQKDGSTTSLGLNGNDWRGLYWDNYGGTCYVTTQFPPNTDQPDALISCVSTTRSPCVAVANGSGNSIQYFRSNHTGGAHGVLADGAVRFISNNVDTTTFKRLGSKGDGNVLGDF